MTPIKLSDLVSPLSVNDFLTTTYGNEVRHFPGPNNRFADLANWETLNILLETQVFDPTRCRLFNNSRHIPHEEYTERIARKFDPPYEQIVVSSFLDRIRTGATLTFDRVEKAHHPVRSMTRVLESELKADVTAHLFASWKPVPGFALHWDDQDALILQLEGSKRWQIFPATTPWPSRIGVAENPSPQDNEPIMQIELTVGDVLYVPHGWWHAVSATNEPSLHLTLGISPDDGIDFMTWLVDRLREHESFRCRLPRLTSVDQQKKHLDLLRATIDDLLATPEILDEYYLYSDGTSRGRPTLGFPDILDEYSKPDMDRRIRLLAPRAAVTRIADGYTLTALGRSWLFPAVAEPIIRLLLLPHEVSVSDIVARAAPLSEDSACELLFTLQRAGVISLI
jgi:ribosomal protein L16 Arg81 hydroxylase